MSGGWEEERHCERGGKPTARQGGKRGEREATKRKTQILTVKRHYTSRRNNKEHAGARRG
jgi:hypothetical protein